MLTQRLLSDLQTVIANGSNERPVMAEMRRSRTAGADPNRPFKAAVANVRYPIAKRSFSCRDLLGR